MQLDNLSGNIMTNKEPAIEWMAVRYTSVAYKGKVMPNNHNTLLMEHNSFSIFLIFLYRVLYLVSKLSIL
jgi:hypothetical protein